MPGWMTSDFTSATFASRLNRLKDSVNLRASSAVPFTSKVEMEPAPFG